LRKQANEITRNGYRLDLAERDIEGLDHKVKEEIDELREDLEKESVARESGDKELIKTIDQKTQIIADTAIRLEHRQIKIDTKLAVGWGAAVVGAGIAAYIGSMLFSWLAK